MPGQTKAEALHRAKGSKRARTKATLIEAAAEVIGEKGYDRASLEEIAARAEMTRGAVYGNFKNKEELFLALIESRWKPIVPPLQAGASLKEQMRILGKTVAKEARARRGQAAAATAFQLYTLTHAAMRSRLTQQNAAIYRRMAKELLRFVPARKLPMPAEKFVRVVDAMITGLLFTYFQTPELISEELIISALEALG
ncbi:MAG TPA: helix-turn-helix domain-containing protein [Candidatus Acidoferrales bacterium]|jgi:AcrR family transcriptional regulator|nr:helix-turn-helix domain-containing protein [Candidatus Acidoferrales bacterium]